MKPDLIVCIGPGGTGKTTFCSALEYALAPRDGATFYASSTRKWYGQYCADPVFGPNAKISATQEGYDPIFQRYLKRCYLEEVAKNGRYHADIDDNFVIMDRSPFCHMAYAQYGELKEFATDKTNDIAKLEAVRRENYLFLGQWIGIIEAYFAAIHFVQFTFTGKPQEEILASYAAIAPAAEDNFRDTSPIKNAALDNLMRFNYLEFREYCNATFSSLETRITCFTPHILPADKLVEKFISESLIEF